MPENAVYVGIASKWGNPFKILLTERANRENAIDDYEQWLKDELERDPHFLDYLEGKDLSCWCSLGQKCHADIIIKVMKEKGLEAV